MRIRSNSWLVAFLFVTIRVASAVPKTPGAIEKELRVVPDKTRAEERFFKSVYAYEKALEDDDWSRPRTVQVLSPTDGSLRHAHSTSPVEQGTEVHTWRLLLRIVPDANSLPPKR